jgi:hypothetical protein
MKHKTSKAHSQLSQEAYHCLHFANNLSNRGIGDTSDTATVFQPQYTHPPETPCDAQWRRLRAIPLHRQFKNIDNLATG